MGLVPVSQLWQVPAIRDAVLKAEPGTVNVVSSSGGHVIVLVLAHERAGQRDLSMPEVRTDITDALRARKEQVLRSAYLAVVRNEATVENHLARRLVENRGTMPNLLPAPPGR
jgi:peptidyl-prolyl cis-trans isomerase SurA